MIFIPDPTNPATCIAHASYVPEDGGGSENKTDGMGP